MKPKFKIISLFLVLCLAAGLMPVVTLAAAADTGKAIQLADSGTAANIGGGQADNIYFGTYQQSSNGSGGYNTDPVKWRVLANESGKLFLISDQNLDVFRYHAEKEDVTWETSTMRSWLNGLAANQGDGEEAIDYSDDNFLDTAFSVREQEAIAETEVVNDDNPLYGTEGGNNTVDKIFLLSIDEAENISYFADNNSRIATNTAYVADGGKINSSRRDVGTADYWYLRSPALHAYDVSRVYDNGYVDDFGDYVNRPYTVRPVFNLDLSSVLFTSAAAGGKSTVGMDSGLAAVGDYNGNEWKLTLLDGSRSFSVSGAITNVSQNMVSFSYSNAQTGPNEYISAIIVVNGAITHYGRILQLDGTVNGASGMINLTLPTDVTSSSAKLYVFNEQYNGDYRTDYASGLMGLEMPSIGSGTQDSRQVELRSTDTHIQWKYTDEGEEAWRNLASFDDLTGDKGQDGQDGADGQDGREVELQAADGYIQWRYTGGTWSNLIALSILQGANGADGADGEDGKDGKDGITPQLRINADTNMWEVSYDNGATWTSLNVNATGVDGRDGADGLTPYIGGNGNWWIGDTDTGIKAAGTDGADGRDGADGLTPYIGGIGNWWIGDTDTGIKAAGTDGADGRDGVDGQDGADGLTPYIGGNGNWWIGDTDTEIKAAGTDGADGRDGADGQDGADGVGIADIRINENDELIVILTDGTEKNLGKITGNDGVGITGATIDENGELILTLSDGTELNAGIVRTEEAMQAMATVNEQNSDQTSLLYVFMGISGISFAGMIGMLIYLLKKHKSPVGK